MLLKVDEVEKWELLLEDVDKDSVPLDCVKKILFKLKGGRQKTINLKKLRDNGLQLEEIETVITRSMLDLKDDIVNMDLVIDIKIVADYVQPLTDKLLEKL